jgi:hypothetical protein
MAIYNNEGLVAEMDNTNNKSSIELQLAHKLKRSQWIAAVVNCENGAVAHTTPVYVVVDGKPTYDPEKAPSIIQKQVASIQDLMKEELKKVPVDQGIIERYNAAISFYKMLQTQIKNETGSDNY